ncbi:hypothetical protein ACSS6W_001356 [Trichoderma asperelloides]
MAANGVSARLRKNGREQKRGLERGFTWLMRLKHVGLPVCAATSFSTSICVVQLAILLPPRLRPALPTTNPAPDSLGVRSAGDG